MQRLGAFLAYSQPWFHPQHCIWSPEYCHMWPPNKTHTSTQWQANSLVHSMHSSTQTRSKYCFHLTFAWTQILPIKSNDIKRWNDYWNHGLSWLTQKGRYFFLHNYQFPFIHPPVLTGYFSRVTGLPAPSAGFSHRRAMWDWALSKQGTARESTHRAPSRMLGQPAPKQ